MGKRSTNRWAWGVAVVLAAAVLAGCVPLGVCVHRCWVARHHGKRADPRGASLIFAPLRRADLRGANLTAADLAGAHNDARTRWSYGFVPQRHGAVFVR